MSYNTVGYIYNASIWVGYFVWATLLIRLCNGLFKKRNDVVKTTIKYLVNSLVFLFVPLVAISFAIVVGNRDLDWAKRYSIEWIFWAITFTIILTIFNVLYQKRIEKKGNTKEAILISVVDLVIMCFGIFLGIEIGIAT